MLFLKFISKNIFNFLEQFNLILDAQIFIIKNKSEKSDLKLSKNIALFQLFNFKNSLKAQVKVKNVTTDDSVFVVECFPQDCNLGSDRPARFGFMGMFAEPMEVKVQN